MREVAIKDLALLCRRERVPYAGLALPPPRPRDRASLNHLAEGFVAGLQAALPSTVPTILRTASKLQVQSNMTRS
jgi:hypothetical protein